ncbi:MAG: Gldg family protein [Kofleriaceae bacterium]|nr:Gldg family protein [Kofleriaceae bacterium]
MNALRAAYWVARRELHVMLRAPIVYVVGGVFLVVQGVAFAGLVGQLSDPRRPAPLGTLLESQLAGTLLTWVLELVVLTLLGMRAIADDKKSGSWELLLTAQVGEGAAVVGKWVAASLIYALLWLPTLAYLGVVAAFRADDGGWDLATIAVGYAGAIAIGAALLAWTIAASAAMSSTLGAGALGFALLIGMFLIGELPALWPDLAVEHPSIASGLEAASVRNLALTFARGELALPSIIAVVALAVVGLSLAITLACAGRRRRVEVRTRAASTALLAIMGLTVSVLAVRHPVRIDVSAARRNSLDPATIAVLRDLPGRATVTIVEPTLGGLEPIYDEVARVVDRMAETASLRVLRVDPAHAPGGLAAIARDAGLAPGDLASGGAVVIELGDRRRVVDLLSLATIERGVGGAPTIERLAIEQAIGGALAGLAIGAPITACLTTGHGELARASAAADATEATDFTVVANRLRGEGMTVADITLDAGVPVRCTVLLVAGPTTPLSGAEALAVQQYLAGGGALLVAAPSRTLAGGLGATGLEAVLAADGLTLPPAIIVDPSLTVRELPGALLLVDGYADHPINAGFRGARPTLWFQPRAVVVGQDATPLVSASATSWGERDLVHAPPQRDPDDLQGPVAIAALGKSGRTLAVGSAESLSKAVLAGGASAADLWLARAVRALARRPEPTIDAPARAPDQIRLVMTSAQRRAVIALSVGGIPLAWALLGGVLVWWRRRKRPA